MFGLSNVSVSAFLAVAAALFLIFNIAVVLWFKFMVKDQDINVIKSDLKEKFFEVDDILF